MRRPTDQQTATASLNYRYRFSGNAMKLLKGAKSFRKSKRKSGTSDGPNQSASPLDSPTSVNAQEETHDAAGPTPPASPQGGDDSQDGSAPGTPSRSRTGNYRSLRPLRLGSFNFDCPGVNTVNANGSSNPHPGNPDFPPLFREADDMVLFANLIYTLAELRDLARNGVLAEPAQSKRILELPLPIDVAFKIISAEGELLKEVLDDGKHEATLSALEGLMDRQQEKMMAFAAQEDAQKKKAAEDKKKAKKDKGTFSWMKRWDGCLAGGFSFDELFCGDLTHVNDKEGEASCDEGTAAEQQSVESSMLTAVGDLKSNEELVYAVGINPIEERITVVFRGSVTKNDFLTDAKITMVKAPDPRVLNETESEDSIGGDVGIHQGFYEYLFGGSGDKPSKYDEIVEHIHHLLAENPARRRYKLYSTGHSLGGALATMFGFYIAASTMMPLPVTIISVASPRVGNVAFARTFAEMESQGKIRHLRIANNKDPVTLGPTVSSRRALALSAKAFSPLGYLALTLTGNNEGGDDEIYYHTGMKMKLFKNVSAVGSQRFEMSYSGATIVSGKPVAIDKDDVAEIEQSNKRKKKESSAELPMVSYHFGTSYSERLAAVESDLKGLTLNNLYREKACGMPWVV